MSAAADAAVAMSNMQNAELGEVIDLAHAVERAWKSVAGELDRARTTVLEAEAATASAQTMAASAALAQGSTAAAAGAMAHASVDGLVRSSEAAAHSAAAQVAQLAAELRAVRAQAQVLRQEKAAAEARAAAAEATVAAKDAEIDELTRRLGAVLGTSSSPSRPQAVTQAPKAARWRASSDDAALAAMLAQAEVESREREAARARIAAARRQVDYLPPAIIRGEPSRGPGEAGSSSVAAALSELNAFRAFLDG
ncbi:uncharacterized protein AMSG_04392 [Thecamonas trahens ATCC 50062]|uniref:Uncharacterized protein n=1 Tax=Thecamonas trahens ATCC 50062 TaxID=461836 RepID=A0A0L0DA45_THETB|nr:hypothetical protein AMSG_04392 [Thecamonas trahens ATCC 50062]KNC48163.1 hypothetical protein AMSG_04392 [Thecamonas trahens ATCC 50062]|eukprot:XP_013758733.1 hypothetical protein AMSG_04392 [Thecamonas trahens ATCC 50062]